MMLRGDHEPMQRGMAKFAAAMAAVLVLTTAVLAAVGPRIAADQPRYEFGSVKAGVRAEHLFKIKNVGDQLLTISKVESS